MSQVRRLCSPPSRVLLATDLTDLERTLPIAMAYAQKFKAELTIAHVLPDAKYPDIDPFLMAYADHAAAERYASARLKSAVEATTKAGMSCNIIMRSGDIVKILQQMVQEWKPDRVIVGSQGAQKFHRNILGSVAEAIMRELDVPVIAISPEAAQRHGLGGPKPRILFATNLDRKSTALAHSVVECAQSHRADLMMLHVIPETGEDEAAALRRRSQAEHIFQETLRGLGPEETRPSCMIECGSVPDTILRVARQEHVDLIILGEVKASSFRRDILPGAAYGVLCGAPCPVMTLKAEPGAETEQLSAAS